MAEQVSGSGSEGKLEDKPAETTENDHANDNTETPRNDRFKVRQVGFSDPENPSTIPEEEKKDDTEDPEELNQSDVRPNEPPSPHEHFTHGYATNEALPMTVFYRNDSSQTQKAKQRPTLQELRKGLDSDSPFQPLVEQVQDDKQEDPQLEIKGSTANAPKFGWIKGVLFGCLLNIWGVMLYLRLSWVVGQAGIGMATVIILLSAVVTILTTLSMSAICTNGEVKGGGAYFLISRSLGPEFGGSIGVIFSIANAVAIAMYVVGFAETVRDLLRDNDALMVDEVNDIRIIGLITVIILFGVAIVGLQWVVRTQIVLLAILIISILNVIIGSFIGPQNAASHAKGFTGYNKDVFNANIKQGYQGEGFFSVFAVFFPAATGILAGVNISGDLKNVNTAIPKGTMFAIIISSLVYVLLAWIVGATYAREATGIIASGIVNATLANANGTEPMSCLTSDCKYGLLNDFQVMEKLSGWGPIVTAGIFASTLSSALASFVGAPKTFQAVCKDKLFPKIEFFAKGYGPGNEPRRGYLLAFIIAVAFIAIGELNAIAPIISNFFLICYALINYAVFAASLGNSPGWRPSFKYYNMWVSLVGALLCVVIMFLIKWWSALLTIIICVGLYKFVDHRKPEVNWGSSGQANTYMTALRLTNRLETQAEHVKNFRPQFLVLTGRPSKHLALMTIVSQMSKNVGLMMYGNVYVGDGGIPEEHAIEDRKWLEEHKIKAFGAVTTAPNLRAGVQSMFHLCGIGKIRPNTVVIGYMENWRRESKDLVNFFGIINDAFDFNYGLCVLRMGGKELDIEDGVSSDSETEAENQNQNQDVEKGVKVPLKEAAEPLSSEITFKGKQRGTIDVWWLYDDGGLTVLLPYLLTQHRLWGGCQLRLFSLNIRSKHTIKATELKMANLMKKFRITVSSVEQVSGANTNPSKKSLDAFKKLVGDEELEGGELTDQKVLRAIRVGELVRERSMDANLVVISLPIPVAEVTTPNLYMSMLEALSADLPPVLLIRGNQSSVLTFYS